jgi:pantoate--beta-alanine ligase
LLLFTQIAPLRAYLDAQKLLGSTIGFVPTMGALHQGHVSLIQLGKAQTDLTVCSIFVNPTQFNNADDLAKYPRTIEDDMLMLEQTGCDVLFHPNPSEMYPEGMAVTAYNWGAVTHSMEGHFRPGHFDGVIAIVKRLFEVVKPDIAFFGRKDYQQCAVIAKMCQEFKVPVRLVLGDTLREADGLAMSSRNRRLSELERIEAVRVSQALRHIKEANFNDEPSLLIEEATKIITQSSLLTIEYLTIVDASTLEEVRQWSDGKDYVALIAVWCGNVRLIDNMQLGD